MLKMKTYLLTYWIDVESHINIGVFSSYGRAINAREQYMEEHASKIDDFEISEFILDIPKKTT